MRDATAEAGSDIRLAVLPAELTADAGRVIGEQLATMAPEDPQQ